MHREVLEPDKVLVIHDFLSSEECADLIRRSKGLRYERGTVADVVIEDVRNNDRVLVDDLSLASDLFRRAEPSLPPVVEGCRLSGSTNGGGFIGINLARPSSLIATVRIFGQRV